MGQPYDFSPHLTTAKKSAVTPDWNGCRFSLVNQVKTMLNLISGAYLVVFLVAFGAVVLSSLVNWAPKSLI